MFNFFKKKTDTEMEIENYENKPTAVHFSEIPSGDFSLTVEDVFSITGRGIVVVGKVSQGEIRVGDAVSIVGMGGSIKATTRIVGIEMFRKILDYAKTGDNVGLLLSEISKSNVSAGDRIVK